jgi:outer membrane protein assembly factor BamB
MEERLLKTGPRLHRRFAHITRCLGAAALIVAQADLAWSWQTAHGQPDNTHFANVTTKPAIKAYVTGKLGTISLGSGPVIAPDGTVYVGTEEGYLVALRPDDLCHRRAQAGRRQTESPRPL